MYVHDQIHITIYSAFKRVIGFVNQRLLWRRKAVTIWWIIKIAHILMTNESDWQNKQAEGHIIEGGRHRIISSISHWLSYITRHSSRCLHWKYFINTPPGAAGLSWTSISLWWHIQMLVPRLLGVFRWGPQRFVCGVSKWTRWRTAHHDPPEGVLQQWLLNHHAHLTFL